MVITRMKEEVLSSPRLNNIRERFGGVVVIGGANIDLRGRPAGEVLERHTSNPGKINVGSGGVGRNIAHNLALLNVPVTLLSAVGDDGEGIRILEETGKAGVRTEQMIISGEHPTGIYLAILDEKGEMEVAVSDMQILEEISLEYLRSKAYLIKESKIVVMDTNIPEESIEYVVDLCNKVNVPLLIEPVSAEKARKLMSKNVIITLGKRGIYVSCGGAGDSNKGGQNEPGKFMVPYKGEVVDVTGAGDALVAGLVYGIYKGYSLEVAARFGLGAAALTISTKEAVRRDLREGLLRSRIEEEKEGGRLL
jgi:pseudouridine kinase